MAKDTLSITDNRTGKTYEVPVENDTIRAMDLRQIKVNDDDFGMMTYDPAYVNTASCKSTITFIDGDRGILEYRGIPIEQIAEKSNYMEASYLVVHGKLPNQAELDGWVNSISEHTFLHENAKKFIDGYRYDAHPMGMFVSTVAALSTFYPESKNILDAETRMQQIHRLIAKVPLVAAYSYRHAMGMPYVNPDPSLTYSGNFLNMLFRRHEPAYKPNPILERALDVLFILHADHEQNCSTSTMRLVGSSLCDPFCSLAAAAAALYGPLHGGANEAVLRMLNEIGSTDNIPAFIKRVKDREVKLMGFGHRVYKNYDPRARIIKQTADEVFEVTGRNRLLDIALELERIALEDDYFISKKLYPNVDFYSGIIYQAMGFPVDMFPVLFAIGRTSGWLSQWQEMLLDKEQKIGRPRQVYLGERQANFVEMADR